MKRLFLAVVGAALCGCSAVSNYPILASAPKASPSPTAVSCAVTAQSTSHVGFGAPNTQALDAVEQLTGVEAAWTLTYPVFGNSFNAAAACQSTEHGAMPIIQIDPYHTRLAAIAAGEYDSYLRTFALAVKSFGAPIILSFAHEMNGRWYPWGWTRTRPAVFVKAWRHIVTIFRQERADNGTWMWTINIDRPGSTVSQAPAAWWPGSQYVGIVGVDGYFRYPGDTWDTVFGNVIAQVRRITSDPVLVSETGVLVDATSYAQTASLFTGVKQNHLLGFVWLNESRTKDWQLQDDPAALAAFRAAMRHTAART